MGCASKMKEQINILGRFGGYDLESVFLGARPFSFRLELSI